MSDAWFSEDFFAPLDSSPEGIRKAPPKPSDSAESVVPARDRAPAKVLFEVQNGLYELARALERVENLHGRAKHEFEDELDRIYVALNKYLGGRSR